MDFLNDSSCLDANSSTAPSKLTAREYCGVKKKTPSRVSVFSLFSSLWMNFNDELPDIHHDSLRQSDPADSSHHFYIVNNWVKNRIRWDKKTAFNIYAPASVYDLNVHSNSSVCSHHQTSSFSVCLISRCLLFNFQLCCPHQDIMGFQASRCGWKDDKMSDS